jgi:hypothetical protein
MLLMPTPCPNRTTRDRDHLYRLVTRMLSVALLPLALVVAPHRARHVACQWALATRFPAEGARWLERWPRSSPSRAPVTSRAAHATL